MKHIVKLLLPAVICLLFSIYVHGQVTKTLNGVVRYESGMSETKFSTPNGDVVMKLPQSMSGTTITGTVSAEPAGKTEKEKNKNLEQLLKFVVNLDGQKIPITPTPTNFDWVTHLDRQLRTPVELLNVSGVKVLELSLPPVLSAPATGVWQSDRTPLLTTPSNVLVKGDALNVYTNQQFSPGEKFVLTDSKGQEFTVKPVCLSANQAVITVPAGALPGEMTVREEIWNQPISKYTVPPNLKLNLIDINLSSPNTNLRNGQTSSVTLAIDTRDPAEIDSNEFLVFKVDVKNLTPGVVDMTGGNMQRVSFPLNENRQDPSAWRLSRTITGVKPGVFSVSATLHEDYTTSNDPFRPQLNVLKTPEDFNAWANALKKDLQTYAAVSYDDETGSRIVKWIQRAIDNMPVCTNPEQLDECKAVAYSLLQPLHVPKGAAISWHSSYEALKAATKVIDNNLAGKRELIDFDVIKNGLEFISIVGQQLKDETLKNGAAELLSQHVDPRSKGTAVVGTDHAWGSLDLQEFSKKVNTLTTDADPKIGADPYRFYKYTMQDLLVSSYAVKNTSRQADSLRKFKDAFIMEISFPEMDAANKETTKITVYFNPKELSIEKKNQSTPSKPWAATNFRIEIDGLPCKKIAKVDGFTIKQNVKHMGQVVPQNPMRLIISAEDIKPWQEWFSIVSEKKGRIEYLDEKNNSLVTVDLSKTKPVSIAPASNGRFQVSIAPESVEINYSPGMLTNLISTIDPGRVHRPDDLVAVFNPLSKKLYYSPEYKNQIFEKMQPRLRADGKYDVTVLSINRKPIQMAINIVTAPPDVLFDVTKEDSTKKFDKYGFESTGEMITEKWESTGAGYRFYKNAKCQQWREGKEGNCSAETKKDEATGEYVETGKYYKLVSSALSHCYKGTEFCTEMYIIDLIEYIYDDKDCKRLIQVKTFKTWSCE